MNEENHFNDEIVHEANKSGDNNMLVGIDPTEETSIDLHSKNSPEQAETLDIEYLEADPPLESNIPVEDTTTSVDNTVSDSSFSQTDSIFETNHVDNNDFSQNSSVTDNNSWFSDQTNVVHENTNQPKKEDATFKSGISSKPRYVSYKSRLARYVGVSVVALIFLVLSVVAYFSINVTSSYDEESNIEYQVCLSDNEYYSTSCIGENVEYLTAISDVIRANFNYAAVYQEASERSFKYYIKTNLLIKTISEPEKELLSKEREITDVKESTSSAQVLTVTETVEIPFQEYNDYAQKYKNDFSILSNCELVVSLVERGDGNKDREISSFTIPLTKSTYNITKNEMKKHSEPYIVPELQQKRNLVLAVVALAIIINIVVWLKLIRFMFTTTKHDSEYEKKLKKILSTYDRVIVTLSDNKRIDFSHDVYTVNSFMELLDVRDTIDKPILYYKVNSVKTEFYVQDVDKVYKYTMKEADFEKPDQGDI